MVDKNQVESAPHFPGIYFFKNDTGKIIYIGKALNLKMRLISYFRKDELDVKKRAMLKEAKSVTWKKLNSEIEALLLETSLIKRHHPKYNVSMRDDKQYFYVAFTSEKLPKIFITHQPNNDPSRTWIRRSKSDFVEYIGPFTDGWAIKTVLKKLRRAFPYCRCGARSTAGHYRPCQQASLGRCLGICCLKEKEWDKFYPDSTQITKKYKENVKTIKKILSGKHVSVIKKDIKEMKKSSVEKNYERAAELRDEIKALKNIFDHRPYLSRDEESWRQKGLGYLKTILGLKNTKRIEFFDISNLQGRLAVGSMAVFTNGVSDKKEYKKFRIRLPEKPNDTAMIKEILSRRLKHEDWQSPDLIIIDGGRGQLSAGLSAKYGSGKKIKIVALAKKEEELYFTDGKVIKLKEEPEPMLHLIASMRDEAHRFAISYHRKLRAKQATI